MFEWLPDNIAAVQAMPAAQEQEWTFLLNRPASEDDLRRCEAALGVSLPPSYRAFLLRWDGASLFRRDSLLPDGRVLVTAEVGIQGSHDLPGFHRMVSNYWRAEDWGRLLLFCNIPGPGACYCALNAERSTPEGEYAVVDCDSDYGPRCWRRAVVAASLEDWLRRAFDAALQGGDPYYWLNRPGLRELYRECDEEDRRLMEEWRRKRAQGLDVPPPGPIVEPRQGSIVATRHEIRRCDDAGQPE